MEALEPVSRVVTLSSSPADQTCSHRSPLHGPFARVYLLARGLFSAGPERKRRAVESSSQRLCFRSETGAARAQRAGAGCSRKTLIVRQLAERGPELPKRFTPYLKL